MGNFEDPEADIGERQRSLSRGQKWGTGQGKLEMDSAHVASWKPYSPKTE
jgi:hypothetical protein